MFSVFVSDSSRYRDISDKLVWGYRAVITAKLFELVSMSDVIDACLLRNPQLVGKQDTIFKLNSFLRVDYP